MLGHVQAVSEGASHCKELEHSHRGKQKGLWDPEREDNGGLINATLYNIQEGEFQNQN